MHALEHTSVRLWASKARFLIADHVSEPGNRRHAPAADSDVDIATSSTQGVGGCPAFASWPEGRPLSCGPLGGGQLRGCICVSFPGACRILASGLRWRFRVFLPPAVQGGSVGTHPAYAAYFGPFPPFSHTKFLQFLVTGTACLAYGIRLHIWPTKHTAWLAHSCPIPWRVAKTCQTM